VVDLPLRVDLGARPFADRLARDVVGVGHGEEQDEQQEQHAEHGEETVADAAEQKGCH
jgi:hypothetical protein